MQIDLSRLLEEYDRAISDAERALRVASLRLAHARGRKRGVLEAVAFINQQGRAEPTPVAPPVLVEDG